MCEGSCYVDTPLSSYQLSRKANLREQGGTRCKLFNITFILDALSSLHLLFLIFEKSCQILFCVIAFGSREKRL
jgi:hypothetical protein